MTDINAIATRPDCVEIFGVEIRWQSPAPRYGIIAAKRLTREIVFMHREGAGQFFHPLTQDIRHLLPVRQRGELGWRNAEAIKRRGTLQDPPKQPMVEYRRNGLVEDVPLFLDRLRRSDCLHINTQCAAHQMSGADKAPKQPRAVESPCKYADAPPTEDVAFLPIAERFVVQLAGEIIVEQSDV